MRRARHSIYEFIPTVALLTVRNTSRITVAYASLCVFIMPDIAVYAIINSNLAVTKYLLSIGVDPNTHRGFPINTAIQENNAEKVKCLLDSGARIELIMPRLIRTVIQRNNTVIMRILLIHGLRVDYGIAMHVCNKPNFVRLYTQLRPARNHTWGYMRNMSNNIECISLLS